MPRLTSPQSSVLHRAASFTLAVWLGGVFCLFCCGSSMASVFEATATAAVESAPTESCASHACCHAKAESNGEPRESQAIASANGVGCRAAAPLGQAVVLPVKKKLLAPDATRQAARASIAVRDSAESSSRARVSFYADRRETYLRWCVFLI